jgi:DNA invertase Pin-like site-specific DNA recombinase/predicted peroxiredoxin
MALTKTVAVYCRISKDPARLEVGVERQRVDCVELAGRLWPHAQIRLFTDNDLSAADPAVDRPQWRAMLDALRCGDVDQVVAYDQSRLTRQPIEWEQLLVVLGRRGIGSFHTVREGERHVAEGGGRMVSRIIAAVDAEYAEVTRSRVRRAMRQLAAEGLPVGGRLFGYMPAVGDDGRKTRVIVPREAEAIRWAAAEILRGETPASGSGRRTARVCPQDGLAHAPDGPRRPVPRLHRGCANQAAVAAATHQGREPMSGSVAPVNISRCKPTKGGVPMPGKAVVSLTTGLEDPEKVTVAFLVAVGAAESGRPTLMFLTKEAVRLAVEGVAVGVACEGCPPLSSLVGRYAAGGGRYYVCPICFDAKKLDKGGLIPGAEIAGTVPMWEWIGDEGATTFSY